MANLTETSRWDPVYQLETTDPVQAGAPAFPVPFQSNSVPTAGHANVQAQQLLNRTRLLRDSISPTFVIDSDSKLQAWANNTAGNDYSRILIKAGTWTLNTNLTGGSSANPTAIIDISNGRTRSVIGESGSKIVLNNPLTAVAVICGIRGRVTGTHPNLVDPGKEFFFDNVNIEITCNLTVSGGHSVFAFFNCSNLTSCVGNSNASGNGGSSRAFHTCTNLTNCTGTGSGGGSSSAFSSCTNLTNCTGTGSSGSTAFHTCTNLTNCTGTGGGSSGSTAFYTCTNLTNCTGTGGGSSGSTAFHTCTNLTNCTGTGSGDSGGSAFSSCTNLSNCNATCNIINSTVRGAHGFSSCTRLFGCVAIITGSGGDSNGSFCSGFAGCRIGFGNRGSYSINTTDNTTPSWMHPSTSTLPWGQDAAGGYNWQ